LTPASAAPSALTLDAPTNAACRDVLAAAVHHQLGRPLRSVEFITKLQKGSTR
jgi:hypothetical protein